MLQILNRSERTNVLRALYWMIICDDFITDLKFEVHEYSFTSETACAVLEAVRKQDSSTARLTAAETLQSPVTSSSPQLEQIAFLKN